MVQWRGPLCSARSIDFRRGKKCLDSTLMRKPICSMRALRPMAHRTIALTTELMEPCCRGSTCSFIDNVILVFDLIASSLASPGHCVAIPGLQDRGQETAGQEAGHSCWGVGAIKQRHGRSTVLMAALLHSAPPFRSFLSTADRQESPQKNTDSTKSFGFDCIPHFSLLCPSQDVQTPAKQARGGTQKCLVRAAGR